MGLPSAGAVDLGSVLGIRVLIDWSWLIIFALITLSVSQGYRQLHPHWTSAQHWSAGVITSLLFFVSIFLHEMGHSLTARRYGIGVASITLFIFGGLASIRREPKRPGEEFWIAIAGPAVSVALAALFGAVAILVPPSTSLLSMIQGVAQWLALINALLAIFNMIPGFPLDGGRVLRSIVWKLTGDFNRSTRIAAGAGQVAACGLMVWGVALGIQEGSPIGGIWMVFVGWFLLRAARGSVAQLAIRRAISGVRAGDILDTTTPYVSPAISVQDLVREYMMRHDLSRFLVYDGEKLRGLITGSDLDGIPQEDWASTSVQAAMVPCRRLPTVGLNEPVEHVMDLLDENRINQIPVVENGVFHGLATRETIVRMLQKRMQYGQ